MSAMESVADAVERLNRLAATAELRRLAELFTAAGHELSLVGGPVRDAFLGREVSDLDLTTDATPDQTLAIVRPNADAFWEIGREFGTIGARFGRHIFEITTYRSDAYDTQTRRPDVQFGDSLESDLVRRDFTINAMALRLPDSDHAEPRLVDPTGGVDDLLAHTLRTPGAPEVSFGDDPLRILRAARFAAQLGFALDPAALAAARGMADRLMIVSAERIGAELGKLMLAADPVAGIRVLVDSGAAGQVLPEIPALRLEIDEHARHKDVYEHSLTALNRAIELEKSRGHEPNLVLRLAVLLHDIGKPATRVIEPGGVVTFHHHDVLGAKLAAKRLRALRFDNETVKAVAELIRLHLRFFGYSEGAWTDSAVRRYVRDAGPLLEWLHILSRSDVTTRNRRKAEQLEFAYDDLEERIAALAAEEELAAIRPDLDGDDIMRILQLPPGREVGEAYRYLLEERLEDGPLGAEEAEKRLLEWWSARG
jgi:poly(A) polymerase